jgi:hypothetical protein
MSSSPEQLMQVRLDFWSRCQREAAARVAPGYVPAALPDGHAEISASHSGVPSVSTQAATHGAGLPAIDRGA